MNPDMMARKVERWQDFGVCLMTSERWTGAISQFRTGAGVDVSLSGKPRAGSTMMHDTQNEPVAREIATAPYKVDRSS